RFFFSSRRRHTRFSRDWSSDVCSSDLYASTVRSEYRGQPVGVMHACGHDMHVAILMGVAQALAGMRDELAGEVMFIFQPAEEGQIGRASCRERGVTAEVIGA